MEIYWNPGDNGQERQRAKAQGISGNRVSINTYFSDYRRIFAYLTRGVGRTGSSGHLRGRPT
jgi:hypothetical protein